MRKRRFRLLPHTADLMIEVRGEDLPQLFSSCILALFSLLVDRRTVREAEARSAEVTGDTVEEQFFSLLREVFLLFAVHKFLARTAHVRIEGKRVMLTVTGEPLDSSRHTVLREIKAVTAHAMVVERSLGGYLARFVVDV
ncbi:MAG TPA: archease [Candidatus Limnocylindria bacterium]|nr:archease [Candidatus Limnocylindria bacterium]